MIRIAPEMKGKKRSNRLLDFLIAEHGYKNDIAIAKVIGMRASCISKLRSGERKVGPKTILSLYDKTGLTIEQIRGLI